MSARWPMGWVGMLLLGCDPAAKAPHATAGGTDTAAAMDLDTTGPEDTSGPASPASDTAPPDTAPPDTGHPPDTAPPEDTAQPDDTGPYRGAELEPPWPVPTFTVLDQHGVAHTSESLVGQPTVVWFFRDTASACTNDACGYRDLQADFDALGVQIVAVGPTSVAENASWAASLDYHYSIWADTEGVLAAAYDVESPFDEGNLRHAFLLDASGAAVLRYEGAVSVGADPLDLLADATVLVGAGG